MRRLDFSLCIETNLDAVMFICILHPHSALPVVNILPWKSICFIHHILFFNLFECSHYHILLLQDACV